MVVSVREILRGKTKASLYKKSFMNFFTSIHFRDILGRILAKLNGSQQAHTWDFLKRVDAGIEYGELLALLDRVRDVGQNVLAHVQLWKES